MLGRGAGDQPAEVKERMTGAIFQTGREVPSRCARGGIDTHYMRGRNCPASSPRLRRRDGDRQAGDPYSRAARVPTRLWTILTLMSDKPAAPWWFNVFKYCGWWLKTVVEVEDSVIYRYGAALLLFLFILTISGLCMGFWYLQAYHRETHEEMKEMKKYHRETHEEMKKLFGDLGKNIEDVKSDLGTKIEDVDKRVDNVVNEIKLDLQLQRDAVGIVVPEVLSLRRKCRNKATPKSPQQEHENRNQQLYELQARAGVRASSPLLG